MYTYEKNGNRMQHSCIIYLGEYVLALKQSPRDPLISLCIGLTFIHIASQKFASRRHSLIVQVIVSQFPPVDVVVAERLLRSVRFLGVRLGVQAHYAAKPYSGQMVIQS